MRVSGSTSVGSNNGSLPVGFISLTVYIEHVFGGRRMALWNGL